MHASYPHRYISNIQDGRDPGPSTFYHWPEAGQSGSTISSTATAANLPGTGRVIGLAYDAMGNALVKQVNKLAQHRWTRNLKRKQEDKQDVPQNTTQTEPTEDSDFDDEDTDSTATAPNLPGTGRVIGLLYDKIGRVLVKRINRLAVKFGHGPAATAARIREVDQQWKDERKKLGLEVETLEPAAAMKYFKKDLRLLLKYARSDITTTQMQAFEQIKELCISVPYVRRLLIELNASRDLGLAFMGAQGVREVESRVSLLNRARRALVAVSDVTVYGLGKTLGQIHFLEVMQMQNNASNVDVMLKHMVSYLSDGSVSFLALRLLIDIQEQICQFYIQCEGKVDVTVLANGIKEMLDGSDEFEDWEDLDAVLETYFIWWSDTPHSLARKSSATLLEVAYTYAHNLPRAIAALRKQAERWRKNQTNWTSVSVLWSAIERKVGVSDLTVIPYQHLASQVISYRQPTLLDIWRSMISPAFLILRQIHLERHPCWPRISEEVFDLGMGPRRVVPDRRVSSFCDKLVSLLYADDESVRAEAVECINIVCQIDRYFWQTISYKVPPTLTISCSYPPMTGRTRIVFYRYFVQGSQGMRVLKLMSLREHVEICRKGEDAGECYEMETCEHDILWLEVPSNERFSAMEHHAIFAGLDPNTGERQYLACRARPSSLASFESLSLSPVPDGANTIEYEDTQGKITRSFRFYVMVLRFDPEIYPKKNEAKLLKHVCDETGPISWRVFGEQERKNQVQRLAGMGAG